MLKKIYLSLTIIVFASAITYAQSSTFKSAKKEFQALRYAQAIRLLKTELAARPDNKDAQEMIAFSYRSIKDYDNAVHWYEIVTRNNPLKPEWALYYAEALANKQQYESSEHWYRKYLELVNTDTRAKNFTRFYPQVDAFLKNRKQWKISYTNINTAGAEYSPIYYKQGLMFSSNRNLKGVSRRVFEWDQSPFTDLYYVSDLSQVKSVNPDSIRDALRKDVKATGKKFYRENDDDTYPTSNDSKVIATYNLKLLKDTLGEYLASQVAVEKVPGKVNSKYHEGSAALLPDGSLIFTRNNYYKGKYKESKEGINKLKLFTAKAPDWAEIEAFPYNNDQYSVGHPTVNKAGTLLIFASDMPGGFGGTDLYYCKRATISDQWEKPVNMGSTINTEGNEMFPGLHQDSVLFFSSTGHPGLGGLDIFQVGLKGAEPVYNPVNLGAPVNSSVDDFGIIRSDDGTSGFFTSNRKGSDDIYSFNYHPFRIVLQGIVLDSLNGQPIPNSVVSIQADKLNYLKSDDDGKFNQLLVPNANYTVTARKDNYNVATENINTKDISSDTTLTVTLRLNQTHAIAGNPATAGNPSSTGNSGFNCDSVKEALTLGKVYYDLDKSYIRKVAVAPLAHIIAVLKAHPDLQVMAASFCDSRASHGYNVGLSLRRSTSAKAYLVARGIDPKRVKISYFGEDYLVNGCADNVPCTEAEQQLNRRTEFYLIKDGKRILKMDCDWIEATFGNK